jgi:hypothetical protein
MRGIVNHFTRLIGTTTEKIPALDPFLDGIIP